MNLPVIFMHTGYQDYLVHSMRQAQLWDNKVILLGDDSNKRMQEHVEHHLMSDYTDGTQKFSDSYQHMTTGNFEFELFCYNRWVILSNFAEQHSIEKLVYLDSDVATFCNFSDKEDLLDETNIARVCMMDNQANYRWCAAACISYWSRKGLNAFKQFLLEAYTKHVARLQEKWQYHQDHNKAGGVCDMTATYLFVKDNELSPLNKVLEDDSTFDQSMMSADNYFDNEYAMDSRGYKSLTFKDNIPYAYNTILNKEVKMNAIHTNNKQLLTRLIGKE
jgi:hypothetical protein